VFIELTFFHLTVRLRKPASRSFITYLGTGWNESGDFPDAKSWTDYVCRLDERRDQPLQVAMENEEADTARQLSLMPRPQLKIWLSTFHPTRQASWRVLSITNNQQSGFKI
jgi:hypothetical protein